jgi:glycosyltransferase involved in cell wall biosynthesis
VTRVTFSVIVPTTGRRTLARTVAGIVAQLEPGDEVLVGRNDAGDFGNSARQSMIERARGSHLLFMDDDDQFAAGALGAIRRFAAESPDRIGIFRMRYLDGRMLWTEPVLRLRNVSSQMLCVPNIAGKLGRWESPDYPRIADFRFVEETARLQGEPVFREEVVALIRSDRSAPRRAWLRVATPLGELRYRIAPLTRLRRALGRLPAA